MSANRQAAVRQGHRDAGPHGARADDAHRSHRSERRVGRHVGYLGRFAFREKHVDARLRLFRSEQFDEELAFALQSLLKRKSGRSLDRIDAAMSR